MMRLKRAPITHPLERRLKGRSGRRRLIAMLLSQKLVGNDPVIARAFVRVVQLTVFRTSAILTTQDAPEDDLFLILDGEVSVEINGRQVAKRRSGEHVGEMAVIDNDARRAATLVALVDSLVAKVTEPAFSRLADRYPILWRRMAHVLAARLRERSSFVERRRERPTLFIGSSTEMLKTARKIRRELNRETVNARLWTDGVFRPSRFPLEELEQQVRSADFAILVVGPDDTVTSRGSARSVPRDNVVFELGLFMGALGRYRTLVVTPSGADIKIPTDLLGLTVVKFTSKGRQSANSIKRACNSIRAIVHQLGPR
jgi:CRP/FNR family cyclic AMP-dependent transcriptional regulator